MVAHAGELFTACRFRPGLILFQLHGFFSTAPGFGRYRFILRGLHSIASEWLQKRRDRNPFPTSALMRQWMGLKTMVCIFSRHPRPTRPRSIAVTN